MSSQQLTCPTCQTPIESGFRFCPSCGAASPATLDLSPSQPREAEKGTTQGNAAERIVGIIPQVVEVKGLLGLGSDFMTLIVTDQRFLLAVQPEEVSEQHDEFEETLENLLKEEETTWKDLMDTHDFSAAPWMRYAAMDPATILAEQTGNRSIPFTAVENLVLELYSLEEDHMDSIRLTTGGTMIDLSLPWGNGLAAQRILSQVIDFSVTHQEV